MHDSVRSPLPTALLCHYCASERASERPKEVEERSGEERREEKAFLHKEKNLASFLPPSLATLTCNTRACPSIKFLEKQLSELKDPDKKVRTISVF